MFKNVHTKNANRHLSFQGIVIFLLLEGFVSMLLTAD